jgi:hypothetical protein
VQAALRVATDAIGVQRHEVRRRRARRVRWGATAAYLVSVGAAAPFPPLAAVAFLSFLIAVSAWLVELANRPRIPTLNAKAAGALEVEAGRLTVTAGDNSETLPLSAIASGWIEEPDFVVLSLADGRVVAARVQDATERQILLHTLGVGASERVLRVPVYSRAGTLPAGELMAVIAALFVLPGSVFCWSALSVALWTLTSLARLAVVGGFGAAATLVTLASWVLVTLLRRRQVVVGTDGIAIESLMRRFIAFSEIERVSLDDLGAVVQRKNGKAVRLPTGRADAMYPTGQTEEQAFRARRLVDRIAQALAARGTSGALDVKAEWLERGGRSAAEWHKQLEALRRESGDYRRPGITTAELEDIAGDAARTSEQRAAAAFLVARRGADESAVERAIEASADRHVAERLRRALAGELEGEKVRIEVDEPSEIQEQGEPVLRARR